MPTLVIASGEIGGFGLVDYHISRMAFDAVPASFSPTELVLTFATFTYTISGVGFSDVDPTAGTINGIAVTDERGAVVTFTDLDIAVSDFVTAGVLEENNTDVTAIEDLFFGLGWDVTGNDTSEVVGRGTVSVDGVPVELTGNDTFRLMGGNDEIYTSLGRDMAWGGDGDDTIDGGGGRDLLRGNDGNDILRGDNGDDRLFGGRNNDKLYGGNQHDYLNGGQGRDQLRGQGGNDVLDGGKGLDRLYGAKGNDMLNGGLGDDRMWGGAGADEFVFDAVAAGDDNVIFDFLVGTDTLTYTVGVTNVTDVGGDAQLNFASGGTALFIGVTKFELDEMLGFL